MDAHLASGHPGVSEQPGHPRTDRGARSSPGGRRWRRFRRRRSATWCSSATAGPARPRWPRPCCSRPARSPHRSGRGRHDRVRLRSRGDQAPDLGLARPGAARVRGSQDQRDRHPGVRRLRDRRRRGDACGRPRRVRRLRGRGRRGADGDRVAHGRRARAPSHRVRQQARSRARVVRADARTAEGPLRRRHRAARAAHRRGGRVPWRRRPALRHGRDLRRRLAARQRGSGPRRHGRRGALRARRARRGHRRRRRRPHRAVPRRRGDRRVRARPALATGIDAATVFPVLCGSATKLIGVDRLARFIVEEGPEPHVTGDDGQTALFVFKTIVDPTWSCEPLEGAPGRLHTDDTSRTSAPWTTSAAAARRTGQ